MIMCILLKCLVSRHGKCLVSRHGRLDKKLLVSRQARLDKKLLVSRQARLDKKLFGNFSHSSRSYLPEVREELLKLTSKLNRVE